MRVPELPTLAVVAVVAVGLAVATADWRAGATLVGAGVLLAAGLRLSLPPRAAGWLVVRSRAFDAAVLLVLGFGVIALAGSIPPPS